MSDRVEGYADAVSRVIQGLVAEVREIDAAIERLQGKRAGLIESIEVLEVRMATAEEGQDAGASRAPRRSAAEVVRAHMSGSPERWYVAGDLRQNTGLSAAAIGTTLSYLLGQGELERRPVEQDGLQVPGRSRWQYRWNAVREVASAMERGRVVAMRSGA